MDAANSETKGLLRAPDALHGNAAQAPCSICIVFIAYPPVCYGGIMHFAVLLVRNLAPSLG